ncbi:heterodisulfide reductase-related iron-sulfur binding cluster [Corynebacterium sp. P5848]|uniref:(Fe-S)-binding protein n=1 Tax=Corynebacterium marambiense TaxID=2765364 RepID=UPI002260EC27|nr:heterodisulfide reductase-related iron-sulfur binding cluster [Corynebacterium marambiense]MCX7542976.1 heterodisulfide reductase-related iron-sulfur binding cluster [Corynebacterium marambiense]
MTLAAAPTMTSTTVVLGIIGFLLSLPAWFYFLRGASRLFRLVRAGQPLPGRTDRPARRVGTLFKEVVFHSELARKPAIAAAHWLVMVGFLIGFVLWFEAYIQTFWPRGGWPIVSEWGMYHLADELLGIGTVAGICFLIGARLHAGTRERMSRFYGSNARAAHFVEGVVLIEGLGMIAVKSAKIATYDDIHPHLWSDFLTMHIAQLLPASPVMVSVFALIKLLSGTIWLFVVGRQLSWGVAWHRITAFFTIFLQRNADGAPALGALAPMVSRGEQVTLDSVDELDPDADPIGTGTLRDASWKMLLDATTCTDCGRCQEQCPAWNTAKPLSPKLLMTDLRDAMVTNSPYLLDPSLLDADTSHDGVDVLKLVGEGHTIEPDVLWSCTNCGACVEQCPVDIEHIDHIANMRRFAVLAESEFPSELAGLFKNLEAKGNPWGRNSADRATWIDAARRDGIEVPVFGEDITDFNDTEYLFWVGCAGAYDDEAVKTTRAVVELLHTAGVKFAVLSKGETCTGDPARRAGNEFLFQMLAQENITTLNTVFEGVPKGQRTIITTCAHCFNTLRNEYPDFDGHYDVVHHTQILNKLVREKLLTPVPRRPEDRRPITYHDPCFLGRHNKVFDPPRELLGATGHDLREMDRNRNDAFCCGAGGARMFMDETIGTRINENRTSEALATGAEEIAVGCPFCTVMLTGGVKALSDKPAADQPKVRDVAQMLRDSVLVDGKLPEPRERAFLAPPRRGVTDLGLTSVKPRKAGTCGGASAGRDDRAKSPAPAKPVQPTVPDSAPKAPGTPPVPAAPGAAKPTGPKAPAAPQAPGGAAVPAAPRAPGGATPSAPQSSAPTAPGAPGTPPAPSAPGTTAPAAPKAPGAPTAPKAPGTAVPPAPGSIPPKAPGAPGVPTAPAAPKAPAGPKPAVPPAPGSTTPTAPGASATPKAPGTVTPPVSAAPTPSAPQAPARRISTAPGAPAAPKAPDAPKPAVPPAPGSTTPGTPQPNAPRIPSAPGGSAVPRAPGIPGAPKPPGTVPRAPESRTQPESADTDGSDADSDN